MPQRSSSAAVAAGTTDPACALPGRGSRRPAAARPLRPWHCDDAGPRRRTIAFRRRPRLRLQELSKRRLLLPRQSRSAERPLMTPGLPRGDRLCKWRRARRSRLATWHLHSCSRGRRRRRAAWLPGRVELGGGAVGLALRAIRAERARNPVVRGRVPIWKQVRCDRFARRKHVRRVGTSLPGCRKPVGRGSRPLPEIRGGLRVACYARRGATEESVPRSQG
jgi:hypothetical protein